MTGRERDALIPYVPRLALEWLGDDAGTRHRSIEGTLAFCDLSGFTAMSEKLAGLGRLGAEELSEIINRIFAELLDEAASYGGAMVKYGGDAVLVFFSGDDHAVRGVTATCRMRAALRDVGRVTTSQGRVRVRMSSGLHTGRFDYFLVGESHRELVITGRGATVTCAMEGAADAGEIVLSHALAERLPPALLGDPKGDGVLLRRAPRRRAVAARPFPPPPDVDPTSLVPVALRRHLESGDPQPEHRHATIAFVAFGHVDEMLEGDGPEATADALDAFMARAQTAAARYGVSLMASDVYGNGGKIILTAGAPAAWENNDERVLRAVRDLMDAEDRLPLHIGVERGYVFAGDVGPDYRRTYTILGDAVNTAARVMASCGSAREVRVTPDVLSRAESVFEVEPRPPFAAKGKARPIETVALGARVGARADIAPVAFVGRDAELTELRALIDEARSGARVVAVTGEAGVGKSRLVGEALKGRPFVWARADAFESDVPLATLRLLLVEQAAASPVDADDVPAAAEALIKHLDDVGPGAVVVVDDAHHLDDASIDVLKVVAGNPQPDVVIVLVHRGAQALRDAFVSTGTLGVGALSAEDALELTRSADPSLLPGVARRLVERSAGNPMFLIELVLAQKRGERLAESIESAVAERIDSLAPAHRDLLRTASVLGESFSVGELRELAAASRELDLAAVRPFLARRGDTLSFRQTLFHDVAYTGLTFRRRRALHFAAGRALEAASTDPEAVAGMLGRHFHAAGDWGKAWRYARVAAEQAYRTTYKAIAAGHFERAVDAGTRAGASPLDLATAAADWGQALHFAGRLDDAGAAYRRALRLARGDAVLSADVLARDGVRLLGAGRSRDASRRFARAERLLAPLPLGVAPAVRLKCIGGLLDLRMAKGRSDLDGLVMQALEIAQHGAPKDRARAHTYATYAASAHGRHLEAAAAAEEAARAWSDAGFVGSQAETLVLLGNFRMAAGLLEAGAAALLEARSLAISAGNETTELLASATLGSVRAAQGHADARQVLEEVVPAAEASADFVVMAFSLVERVHAAVLDDSLTAKEVEEMLAEATVAVGNRADELEPDLAAARANVALARGDAEGALAALADADGTEWPLASGARSAALALAGRGDEARDLATALAAKAVTHEEPNPLLGAVGLTLLGRDDEAAPFLALSGVARLPAWIAHAAAHVTLIE